MAALPPLASVLRYGNVRGTDAGMVGPVVDGLVARICIGLPGACASLNDEAAGGHVRADDGGPGCGGAVAEPRPARRLAGDPAPPGRPAGRARAGGRALLPHVARRRGAPAEEAARRLGLALSPPPTRPPPRPGWRASCAAAASCCCTTTALWQVLDTWVTSLPADTFTALLPLLRRTFATFPAAERRKMGEKVRSGPARPAAVSAAEDFDAARAETVLPLVARLLGLAPAG